MRLKDESNTTRISETAISRESESGKLMVLTGLGAVLATCSRLYQMRNKFSLRKSHEFPSPSRTTVTTGVSHRRIMHQSGAGRRSLRAAAFRQLPIHVTPLSHTTMSTISDASISSTATKAPAVVTDGASHSASVRTHRADRKHEELVPLTTYFTGQELKGLHIGALLMVSFYILRYDSYLPLQCNPLITRSQASSSLMFYTYLLIFVTDYDKDPSFSTCTWTAGTYSSIQLAMCLHEYMCQAGIAFMSFQEITCATTVQCLGIILMMQGYQSLGMVMVILAFAVRRTMTEYAARIFSLENVAVWMDLVSRLIRRSGSAEYAA